MIRLLWPGLMVWAAIANAQPWPVHPIRLVVPLSPGGFADTPARILAPRLSAQLGKQVFVENKPGAGGTIGWDFVAKSAPDGHTLAVTGVTQLIGAHLYKNLPYDALKDFTHITMMASGPYVLVVNPRKVPVSSVRELIAAAKEQPGRIDYASSGNGSSQHLVGALFNTIAGVELNHVPYKGSGPAMQDLISGQVKVSFAGIPNALTHLKTGRLRALAVSTSRRWPDLPEVPTVAEAGVAGYEVSPWYGLLAPAATPRAIVARLSAEVNAVVRRADFRQKLAAQGAEPEGNTPEEFAAYLRAEAARWAPVVKASGARAD